MPSSARPLLGLPLSELHVGSVIWIPIKIDKADLVSERPKYNFTNQELQHYPGFSNAFESVPDPVYFSNLPVASKVKKGQKIMRRCIVIMIDHDQQKVTVVYTSSLNHTLEFPPYVIPYLWLPIQPALGGFGDPIPEPQNNTTPDVTAWINLRGAHTVTPTDFTGRSLLCVETFELGTITTIKEALEVARPIVAILEKRLDEGDLESEMD
ncbi:hypothetical protein H0H93_008872 [Arthromyces matolae]|nr:hypothetical protein H0H93_008872 [Arthromyces matolae]